MLILPSCLFSPGLANRPMRAAPIPAILPPVETAMSGTAAMLRVARHEYRRHTLRRGFALTLLGVPLLMSLSIGAGLLIESLRSDGTPVGIVDGAGLFAGSLPLPPDGAGAPIPFLLFAGEAEARTALEDGRIQAYFAVAETYSWNRAVRLTYLEPPGEDVYRQFYDLVQVRLMAGRPPDLARRAALLGEGVITRSLDGRREKSGEGPTFGVMMPLLIGIDFLALLLLTAGTLVQAVSDEKEGRTLELLITSVTPSQLIAGKVLGIVAVSLTQALAWSAVGALAVTAAGRLGLAWFQDPHLPWDAILASLAVAVPAYVLAAALMVAAGATVASGQESETVGSVLALLHLSPLLASWAILSAPNGPLAVALSFLPFTGLLTVVLRNAFSSVPLWQVAAGAAVQCLCAAGAVWLAGRAFRLGMLRYGQRLSLRRLLARSPAPRLPEPSP